MPRSDKIDIQWILDALARDKTKTRKGVGEAIGIDKSGVTRLLNGERALKMRESIKIAAYLCVPVPLGFAEDETPFEHPPTRLAPVWRASPGDDAPYWRLYRGEPPIDRKPKAPHFASAALVFGVYAQDDAMAPRFKAGELLFVDPARPIAPGDDVLFISKRAAGNIERATVGELAKLGPSHFIFVQHGRPGEQRLPAKTWTANLVLRGY